MPRWEPVCATRLIRPAAAQVPLNLHAHLGKALHFKGAHLQDVFCDMFLFGFMLHRITPSVLQTPLNLISTWTDE